MKKLTYRHTLLAAYIGYITQAIVNNLSPLLFVIFAERLGISVVQISVLITVNFVTQIGVDLSSTLFVDRIGYRASVIIAHSLATMGLVFLGVFPLLFANKFAALLLATVTTAVGGGLIEVVVSPLVEALPGDAKVSAMSILHSFYSWGQAGVVLLSTLALLFFGNQNWFVLPLVWALVPLSGLLLFFFVPIERLNEHGASLPFRKLVKQKYFFTFICIMIASGACELGMAQWASYFTEVGLGVSKAVGDVLALCGFAVLMGIGRLLYGKFGERMKLERWITASFALCFFSYLLATLIPGKIAPILGCALSGLSVALMWPGTYSLGAKWMPTGGTLMFALFAFAGDIGCTLGPDTVGFISDAVESGKLSFLTKIVAGTPESLPLKAGMLVTSLFAFVAFFLTLRFVRSGKKQ